MVSHETALAVYGIGEFESARVHFTARPGSTRRDGALSLHRADLLTDDVLDCTGFRVTTPVRSLVEVAGSWPDEDQLARAIEEARECGLLTIRRLRSRAESIDARAALHIELAIQRAAPPCPLRTHCCPSRVG